MWSKSPDSYHAITPACVDICPLIVSVEEKQSAQEFQLFFSYVNMEGNQTRFNECSDSDISFYSGFKTEKYEPKAPSSRVFDPRGVTRVDSQDSLSKFVQSQWK